MNTMLTLWVGAVCLAVLGLTSALICPDGRMCEEGNTCCQTSSGEYGCCPLPNAECCSDHLHCCYEGTVCDLALARCLNRSVSLPWVSRMPSKQPSVPLILEGVKAVVCPDGEAECPDDTTCCQLPEGSWGCCPLAKAVCCQDKRHCCPEGTTCDLVHSKCVSPTLGTFPMSKKVPSRKKQTAVGGQTVTSPGGKGVCPDGFTCCQQPSGEYGCCPYLEAVCCSDLLHCCPGNTTCDMEREMCISSDTKTPLAKKIPATPNDVECPDKLSSCPEDSTCCVLEDGSYGCCPMPNAVCCSDKLHCCPEGTTCDLEESTCLSQNGLTSMAVKFPATVTPTYIPRRVSAVACNGSVACADGTTCCKLVDGQWACCPLPKAVCCDDHLHCCPHDTVCNLAEGTCDDPSSGSALATLLDKAPAFSHASKDNRCDESTSCPGEYTCCKTATGKWACCPLPNAVCCDDLIHCCPHGTVCNLKASTCDDPAGSSVPWVPKLPGLHPGLTQASASSVPPAKNMCDPHTSCPKDTTCCFMNKSGKWGCCPLPKAVCCSDGDHCCPSGYICDDHKGTCTKGLATVPWYPKESALTEEGATSKDVKCDDKSSCASGTTCCKLPTGEWGCCPLVKAVCCADQEHCCPQGYSCNMQTGTCDKKVEGPALSRAPMTRVTAGDAGVDAKCDADGRYRCPERQTCCKTSPTEWSCCPAPQAVCCADAKHCCPMGYMCDLEQGGCSQPAGSSWDMVFTPSKKKDFLPFGL
ncbi:granulin b isoform X1 [Esox lucius]|uniref:granulin b isoform X1 n=1 Tax=Esox lucius TaxID=8010 RepID=UPI00147693DC|nr:granulin b isoform X1 [Esox lucius]XP_010864967.4 granulin b isoform X1 [Esox lucius]